MNPTLKLCTRRAALEAHLLSEHACLELLHARGTDVLKRVLEASVKVGKEFVHGSRLRRVSFKR